MSNLIFKILTLQNFGSYQELQTIELDRGPKLVYITGEHKSQPSLGSNDVGKSTLINALYWTLTGKILRSSRPGSIIEPWGNTDTVTGSLVFNLGDNLHTIVRTRRPNSLQCDGKTVTQERITEILGLSDEAIAHTLIVGQFNELFLDLDPAVQSRLFTELLNLNIWLKAVDVCSKDTSSTTRQVSETEKQISRIEGSLSEVTEQLDAAKQSAAEFETTKKQSLIKLQRQLDESLVKATDSATELAACDLAVKKLPDISEQEQNLQVIRKKELQYQSAVRTSEVSIASNKRELTGVEAQLQEYRDVDNICPACGQEVTTDHIDEKISGYTIRRNKLLDAIENSEQLLRDRLRSQERALKAIDNLEKELINARESNQQVYQQYNQALLDANTDQRTAEELERDIEKTMVSTNPYSSLVVDLGSRCRALSDELGQQQETLAKQNKTLEYLKLWSQGFREIRLNLIDETLDELEFTVNKHIARLGLVDWEVGFHTERETTKGELVHKFTVNIFPPGREQSAAFESLGGGVSTRLQLASFFGLSEILLARAGIIPNIEILDEPTRFMSDQGVEDLLESLKERAIETGRTIYFVDHSRLDKGLFDGVLWIEKTSAGSRIIQ